MRRYLAGPMTRMPDLNRGAFMREERRQRERGHEVVNPHRLHSRRDLTPEQYMAVDLPAMLGCDELVVLPGWEESRGTLRELVCALSAGKPVRRAGDDAPLELELPAIARHLAVVELAERARAGRCDARPLAESGAALTAPPPPPGGGLEARPCSHMPRAEGQA